MLAMLWLWISNYEVTSGIRYDVTMAVKSSYYDGLRECVVLYMVINVSEEPAASTFTVETWSYSTYF
jgi:hypothetical protein